MGQNKKSLKHICIYLSIGVLFFITTILLNYFEIVDIYNTTLNLIIFVAVAVVSLIYYSYMYQNFISSVTVDNCVIMGTITLLILFVQLIFAFKVDGVHLSILVIWNIGAIAFVVYNIITYLRSIDSIEMSKKKYTYIISVMKTWINFTYLGMYIFALVNIFFPTKVGNF